jgi:hypothetical protein
VNLESLAKKATAQREHPPSRLIALFLKFEPCRVRPTAELSAVALVGEMAVSEGISGGGCAPPPPVPPPPEFPAPQDAIRRIVPAKPTVAAEFHTRCNVILVFIETNSVQD